MVGRGHLPGLACPSGRSDVRRRLRSCGRAMADPWVGGRGLPRSSHPEGAFVPVDRDDWWDVLLDLSDSLSGDDRDATVGRPDRGPPVRGRAVARHADHVPHRALRRGRVFRHGRTALHGPRLGATVLAAPRSLARPPSRSGTPRSGGVGSWLLRLDRGSGPNARRSGEAGQGVSFIVLRDILAGRPHARSREADVPRHSASTERCTCSARPISIPVLARLREENVLWRRDLMPRILLIGWDGADWRILEPLLVQGALPN